MKKFAMICLAVLLIAGMSVSAFASTGGFVSSPSGQPGPRLIHVDGGCDAEIVVTPYSGREELEDQGAELEEAYDDIKGTDDVTTLNEDLAALATEKEIPGNDLAVSDLFNMHMEGCDPETHKNENHGAFTITLEADTLENFIGIMHRDGHGKWQLFKDVTVEGDTLTLTTEDFGPYAIVVDTNPDREPPFSGDNAHLLLWAVLAAASGMAMMYCWYQSRKKEA